MPSSWSRSTLMCTRLEGQKCPFFIRPSRSLGQGESNANRGSISVSWMCNNRNKVGDRIPAISNRVGR